MKKLGDVVVENSPFAAAFKMMHKTKEEEIVRGEKEKRAPSPVRMIFDINNREIHS
jgi:hypothetical protein